MPINSSTTATYLARVLLTLLFALTISACAVKLVSSYDEQTDAAVTQLQKQVATFLVTVAGQTGLPECQYDKHKQFYQDSKVAISAISVRANAIAKNQLTVKQVELLKNSLHDLEQLHQLACLTSDQIKTLSNDFNAIFTAILTLELAKKRVQ